ncbi:MAG: HD domain-containing protein [Polyangiales bacterium]|nr:HD domain-containing protein [Myxococcales bacterium]
MPADPLLSFIANDHGLRALLDAVRSRDDGDAAHDVSHCLRVARWTIRLGGADVDRREAVAAALLHDFVNVPKNSPDRNRASALCAEAARPLLAQAEFSPDAVVRIADAIEDHSYSRGAVPRTLLGAALQDADRLEALGALGILRTASTGARMGAHYFNVDDPWASERELDDKRFSIDHFFTKLLPLAETLRTEAGRAEARRRTALMHDFLHALGEEIGAPYRSAGPTPRRQ